ncbi:hypothetical protein MHU86_1270 [Fragilaria crotonensis]|nr:hypothetical protein MHU86_1270 [Fragilaria crotonensis]
MLGKENIGRVKLTETSQHLTKTTSKMTTRAMITGFAVTTTAKFQQQPTQNPPRSDHLQTLTTLLLPQMFPLQKGCVFRCRNSLEFVTTLANMLENVEVSKSITLDVRTLERPKKVRNLSGAPVRAQKHASTFKNPGKQSQDIAVQSDHGGPPILTTTTIVVICTSSSQESWT